MSASSMPVSRRMVMQGAVAAGVIAGIPAPANASSADAPGSLARERAERLMANLSPEQRDAALFPFESDTRRRWNFMGAAPKPGLRLEQMTASQRELALDLLASVLSPAGLDKALTVMSLQDVLRSMGDGPSSRNRDRFSVAVFGTPSATDIWGWRFEGHHLSLSFTLAGDRIVSVTPSSYSSNPNVVPDGSAQGLVTLDGEERIARQLFADLTSAQQARALIGEQPVGNILATAGREGRFVAREGLAAADMTPAQQDLMLRLIDTYAVDHLGGSLAADQAGRVRAGDPQSIHFASAGGSRVGERYYYRLHGDTFVIEFASLRNPLHLHTIRHDTERNLGDHVVQG